MNENLQAMQTIVSEFYRFTVDFNRLPCFLPYMVEAPTQMKLGGCQPNNMRVLILCPVRSFPPARLPSSHGSIRGYRNNHAGRLLVLFVILTNFSDFDHNATFKIYTNYLIGNILNKLLSKDICK